MTTSSYLTPPNKSGSNGRREFSGAPRTKEPSSVDTELVLIRGLPGSGKSTMAKVLALVGYQHFEADMFFVRDGTYCYDRSRIREAHA